LLTVDADAKYSAHGLCAKLVTATSSTYKEIEKEKPVAATNNTADCDSKYGHP